LSEAVIKTFNVFQVQKAFSKINSAEVSRCFFFAHSFA